MANIKIDVLRAWDSKDNRNPENNAEMTELSFEAMETILGGAKNVWGVDPITDDPIG